MFIDDYGCCDYCLWNGKLRKDGNMRRHYRADPINGGRQNPNLGICPGGGEPPHVFMFERLR